MREGKVEWIFERKKKLSGKLSERKTLKNE